VIDGTLGLKRALTRNKTVSIKARQCSLLEENVGLVKEQN
jgi:hypothetical protein